MGNNHHGSGINHRNDEHYQVVRVLSRAERGVWLTNEELWNHVGGDYKAFKNKRNSKTYKRIEKYAPGLVEVKRDTTKKRRIIAWRLNWTGFTRPHEVNAFYRDRVGL